MFTWYLILLFHQNHSKISKVKKFKTFQWRSLLNSNALEVRIYFGTHLGFLVGQNVHSNTFGRSVPICIRLAFPFMFAKHFFPLTIGPPLLALVKVITIWSLPLKKSNFIVPLNVVVGRTPENRPLAGFDAVKPVCAAANE